MSSEASAWGPCQACSSDAAGSARAALGPVQALGACVVLRGPVGSSSPWRLQTSKEGQCSIYQEPFRCKGQVALLTTFTARPPGFSAQGVPCHLVTSLPQGQRKSGPEKTPSLCHADQETHSCREHPLLLIKVTEAVFFSKVHR